MNPPARRTAAKIPIYAPSDRIGSPLIKVDPAKIVGVVETDLDDETGGFDAADPTTDTIGNNVAEFLAERNHSRPHSEEFLPMQSGVGNIANAVLGALGAHPGIPRSRCTPKCCRIPSSS